MLGSVGHCHWTCSYIRDRVYIRDRAISLLEIFVSTPMPSENVRDVVSPMSPIPSAHKERTCPMAPTKAPTQLMIIAGGLMPRRLLF